MGVEVCSQYSATTLATNMTQWRSGCMNGRARNAPMLKVSPNSPASAEKTTMCVRFI